ncbi:tRNA N6-adenosine(37)-N6-threonylcarbamoyltransferase complex dimerization subunit TsaB [Humibacillus sp. DSM 29435]|uniref:tRNA (adenosine(37)-N6)-threonylcarbamoyltransferase complex dimerization subunit type 1 TsaB n=1 Tax=Humibacillus sp. DSM 29435 TaxID=1869167 RepID=UPI000872D6C4|nr:tRNA (adenosine(37)-N6)-threonylcarbamoyltransferase complex dimerization subunit type 1 TsaB [Humibacillus sp. DSM 29435]OFE14746.1 tRNA N6-adenosine(37)-N6-threonylcarbamoyltransferase complex dimerization subunit TsaB [Humibacillus sp. DSM 29435]
MHLLAIDTSTSAITVALFDGSRVTAESTTLDPRAHAEHLAPGIRDVLDQAGVEPGEVTGVVVGIGPGPFTGLRVGIVTARTFGFALGVPVRGLCSHEALAHQAWLAGRRGGLLVATDARRKEVYAAEFTLTSTGSERVGDVLVSRSTDLPEHWRVLPTVGRGPLLYPDSLLGGIPSGVVGSELLDVSAGALGDLAARRWSAGEALPTAALEPGGGFDGLEPLYLRRPDTQPAPPSRKSTLG